MLARHALGRDKPGAADAALAAPLHATSVATNPAFATTHAVLSSDATTRKPAAAAAAAGPPAERGGGVLAAAVAWRLGTAATVAKFASAVAAAQPVAPATASAPAAAFQPSFAVVATPAAPELATAAQPAQPAHSAALAHGVSRVAARGRATLTAARGTNGRSRYAAGNGQRRQLLDF